jgi:putative transposase
MSHSYVNFIYHMVFSTKDREPLITAAYEERLHQYLGGIIRSHDGIALEINGMPDHVHVLAKLRPDEAVSELIRDLKSNATGWMHRVFPELSEFRWQNGYGAFTVSPSQVKKGERLYQEPEGASPGPLV